MNPPLSLETKLGRAWAAIGALIWGATLFGPPLAGAVMHDVAQIMLLGPLILVPLTLSADHPPVEGTQPKLLAWLKRAIMISVGPSSWLVAASFYQAQSVEAALWLLPWLLTTGALALYALLTLKQRGDYNMANLATTASRLYLPGGAVWWMAWRAGFELLQFPLLIVLLTAMHFHFAGYMAPWLAAQAAEHQRATQAEQRLSLPLKVIVGGVISGMPLIAIGIQFSAGVELAATSIFTTSVMALGAYNLRQAPALWRTSRLGAAGVMISAMASFLTMLAAVMFVARHLTDLFNVTIPQMIMWHGWANGLGFALAGALGWVVLIHRRSVTA